MQSSKLDENQEIKSASHRIDMVMLAIVVHLPYSVCRFLQLSHPYRLQLHHYLLLLLHLAEPKRCSCPQNRISFFTQISGAIIMLFVIDFLFAITEMPVWTGDDPINPVWQTIRPLHNFGIFCFVVINLLKIFLLVLTCKAQKLFPQPPNYNQNQ